MEVKITTFINPHLFWFFPTENVQQRKILDDNLKLERHEEIKNAVVEQDVLICNKGKWQRGIVKFKEPTYYLCWLVDYGTFFDTSKLYKLPKKYVGKQALVLQAALNGIVYLKQEYTFNGILQENELEVFSEGVVKCSVEYMRLSKQIYFDCIEKANDILLGDIYIRDSKGKHSLIELLIKDKLISKNQEFFKRAFSKNSLITTDILISYKQFSSFPQSDAQFDKLSPQSNASEFDLVQKQTKGIGRGISPMSKTKWLFKDVKLTTKDDNEKYQPDENVVDHKTQALTNSVDHHTEQNLTDNSLTAKVGSRKPFKQKPIPNFIAAGMETREEDQQTNNKTNKTVKNQSNDVETHSNAIEDENQNSTVQTVTPQGIKFCFGCKCVECECWNFEDIEYVEKNDFKDSKVKTVKIIKKPSQLFKTKEEKCDEDIQTIFYGNSGSKVQRCFIPKILVHGQFIPTPAMSIQDTTFHSYIQRALRSFEQVFTIQNFGWPAIMHNMNTCLVGNANSGKTMAYLPAICTILLERDVHYKNLPTKSVGPVVLILCPSAKVAENVHQSVVNLMEPTPKKFKIALAVQMLDKKCLMQFDNQCDLLITTPPALLSLLKVRIITLKLLCNLVLECADMLLKKFHEEMGALFELIKSMLSHRNCNYSVQLITVSEQWTHPLEKLMKNLNYMPIICITSYLEAALYGRASLQLHFLQSQMKAVKLAELLKNNTKVCRTIVICNTESEIKTINEYLMYNGISTLPLYNVMDKNEILEMESKWLHSKDGKHLVLVCTDKLYSQNIDIRNANILVHYSLPDYWSDFTSRFKCLLDSYASPLTTKTPDGWMTCVVHIFIDEVNTKQYPRLYRLLERSNAFLPENFKNYYKKCMDDIENVKIESKIALCYNIKIFGNCSLVACTYRHKLSQSLDYVSDLPENGTIRFKILGIINPIAFYVKLLEHIDVDGCERRNLNVHEDLHEKLQESMNTKRICAFTVELDKWYVYYSEEKKLYRRCVVLEILLCNRITKAALTVSVRFIDTGTAMTVSTLFLYELPDEFRSIQPQAIKVMIANSVPSDSDEDWCSNAITKFGYMFYSSKFDSTITYASGKILLRLENMLWLNNVLIREDLKMTKITVTRFNVKKTLELNNLVSFHEEQLVNLYKLCAEANIELPKYDVDIGTKKIVKPLIQSQWAYFDDTEYQEIYITCLNSPSQVFVRLIKYQDLLNNLEKDIQKEIEKIFYCKDFEVMIGGYYLAKDPCNKNFSRVKVIQIEGDDVTVFYVDYGDYATVKSSDLKFLTDELISKLPFQAIECRLYGISPSCNDWLESAINLMDNYIFEPGIDYFRMLYAKVCKYEMSSVTDSPKYAIMLIDNFTQKVVVINKLLVMCGDALEVDDENLCMDITLPKRQDDEIESDCDLSDDRDYTIDEINKYQEKHATDKNDNIEIMDTPKAVDTAEEESVWDIEINDPELFMKQLLGLDEPPGLTVATHNPNIDLPPITVAAPVDYYSPNATWYQTEAQVKIHILLPDVVDYSIHLVRQRLLTFSTIYNSKQYRLNLKLRYKVENNFEHTNMCQYIKVTLIKCTSEEWTQLTFDNKRLRNIKYDVSKITLPQEKKKVFLDLGDDDEEVKVEDHIEYEFGSDEDSESDIESVCSE